MKKIAIWISIIDFPLLELCLLAETITKVMSYIVLNYQKKIFKTIINKKR